MAYSSWHFCFSVWASTRFSSGLIPVPVRPPHSNNVSSTLPTVKMVVDVSKAQALLTTHNVCKLLKTKEASSVVESKSWPVMIVVDDAPKKKLSNPYRAPTPEMIAYIDFSVSTTGMLSGVKVLLLRHALLSCYFSPWQTHSNMSGLADVRIFNCKLCYNKSREKPFGCGFEQIQLPE